MCVAINLASPVYWIADYISNKLHNIPRKALCCLVLFGRMATRRRASCDKSSFQLVWKEKNKQVFIYDINKRSV